MKFTSTFLYDEKDQKMHNFTQIIGRVDSVKQDQIPYRFTVMS